MTITEIKPFDNYEISPCTRTEQPDKPSHFYFEVCEPQEADVWTLYGHIPGEGVEAIGDFATRKDAEEIFQQIIGVPFGNHEENAARLRLMHAAPDLLSDLEDAVFELEQWMEVYPDGSDNTQDVINSARESIAKATSRSMAIPIGQIADAPNANSLHNEMLAALKALAITARTFRSVPHEEQQWTSLDDDALDNAFAVIARAEAVSPSGTAA